MALAQIVTGLAMGAGTGYLGTIVGGRFFAGDPSGFGDIVAQIGGLLLGYPFGASAGVWLGGRLFNGHGAFWATLLGSSLGIGILLLSARLFIDGAVGVGWLLVFACSLAGAVAGYHLSERRRVWGRLSGPG
jgi:hypothetical protein